MLGRLWPRFRSRRTRRADGKEVVEAQAEEAVTVDEPASATVAVRAGDQPPPRERDEIWLDQLPATPEPAAIETAPEVVELEPEPEQEQGQEPEPAPTAEPQPSEPQPDVEEAEAEPAPEPEPEPVAVAPQLVSVPEPEPEPEPDPEPEPPREPEPVVATLPPGPAQEWNLWELERLVRERGGEDPTRDVERGYLVVYLRDFARTDGTLPTEFDGLVRESFGELIAAEAR